MATRATSNETDAPLRFKAVAKGATPSSVSYTHLRAHETS